MRKVGQIKSDQNGVSLGTHHWKTTLTRQKKSGVKNMSKVGPERNQNPETTRRVISEYS